MRYMYLFRKLVDNNMLYLPVNDDELLMCFMLLSLLDKLFHNDFVVTD